MLHDIRHSTTQPITIVTTTRNYCYSTAVCLGRAATCPPVVRMLNHSCPPDGLPLLVPPKVC